MISQPDKNFNIFFKFNIILLLIVYSYHFAICYLLLSAQPSSFFTRLHTRELRTVSLVFILINAILYYVICLMASVPTQASLPVKFHPPKSFRFPKRKFGTKTERLFRAEWCGGVRTIIIHGSTGYDIGTNSAFCHLCMIAAYEGKY